jgi:hypothetical protein
MAAIQNLPRLIDPTAKFGQPITEMVNGTFGVFAASSPFFWRRVAPIKQGEREF